MTKTRAISYAIFGFERETPKNCYEFNGYMRGLMENVRVNRCIYPEWVTVINTDEPTYYSKYRPIFDWLLAKGHIELNIHASNTPLCLAMLWRLFPAFDKQDGDNWDKPKYTHVLCRDIDSVCTYREAQAVQQWITENKCIHCITDSISHNIPMMGGMIGVRPEYLSMRLHVSTWEEMINLGSGINYTNKGADQEFLGRFVYPKCADSATEHFVLGMVRNLPEENGRHYSIDPTIKIDVADRYKQTNDMAGHIGASGAYDTPLVKFLNEVDQYRDEYKEIEKQFPTLFFWSNNG